MHEPWPAVISSAIFVFTFGIFRNTSSIESSDLFQTCFFARAEVRTRMQHQKRELKLICPDQFFGERSNGIGVKLRIGRSEVDQVIGVPEHRQQFAALDVIEKSADFLAGQRSGEPLHIVFHEHLHRGAADRSRALDGHARPATDGHVRAEENVEMASSANRRIGEDAASPVRRFPVFFFCHCYC